MLQRHSARGRGSVQSRTCFRNWLVWPCRLSGPPPQRGPAGHRPAEALASAGRLGAGSFLGATGSPSLTRARRVVPRHTTNCQHSVSWRTQSPSPQPLRTLQNPLRKPFLHTLSPDNRQALGVPDRRQTHACAVWTRVSTRACTPRACPHARRPGFTALSRYSPF